MPSLALAVQWSSLEALPAGSGARWPLANIPLRTWPFTNPGGWRSLRRVTVPPWLPVWFQTLHHPPLDPTAAGNGAIIPACGDPLVQNGLLLFVRHLQGICVFLLDTIFIQDTVLRVYPLILLQSLVFLDLTGKVEGVADARRCQLACTKDLHRQGFSQGLHGLYGLREADCATVTQQASLYKDVLLASWHYVVPIEQVMAVTVFHGQVVIITDHSLVASLADVYIGCTHWQHDNKVVAMPASQNILESVRACNSGAKMIKLCWSEWGEKNDLSNAL